MRTLTVGGGDRLIGGPGRDRRDCGSASDRATAFGDRIERNSNAVAPS
jgi:hypothetical protein